MFFLPFPAVCGKLLADHCRLLCTYKEESACHGSIPQKAPAYDAEKLQPAVRKSYCNREMSLGFIDKETVKFHEHCGANSRRELEDFCRKYKILPEDLKAIC